MSAYFTIIVQYEFKNRNKSKLHITNSGFKLKINYTF